MYSPRLEKLRKTLEVLAYNKEVYQRDLAEKVGCSYRTIVRQLKLLHDLGLARIIRTEPSKRGKDRNVWEITFYGLIEFMSMSFPLRLIRGIDHLASIHKDKWLIFQEWNHLSKDPEIKDMVIAGIGKFLISGKYKPFFYTTKKSAKELEQIAEFRKKIQKLIPDFAETSIKREATIYALYLDFIFPFGAVPPWITKPKSQESSLIKLWKTIIKIPSIREFIEQEFKMEEIRHKNIKWFQKWLLNKC